MLKLVKKEIHSYDKRIGTSCVKMTKKIQLKSMMMFRTHRDLMIFKLYFCFVSNSWIRSKISLSKYSSSFLALSNVWWQNRKKNIFSSSTLLQLTRIYTASAIASDGNCSCACLGAVPICSHVIQGIKAN